MTALELDRVTKRLNGVVAVDGLSFAVEPGGIFGFLGGNGAGKTTTLRMVLDIVRPTSGRIAVFGNPPTRSGCHRIGFLPEERGLYRNLSALDTVTYFGRLKGMTAADASARARELLVGFGLDPNRADGVDRLSKGMAQKVQIATAIVNRPRLLLLDEPFSGLDPVNQQLLETVIRDSAAAGATVLFSTHIMQHAERLCDRLLLLAQGRKLFEGTLADARATMPQRILLESRTTPAGLPGVAVADPEGVQDGWERWLVELNRGVPSEMLFQTCCREGFALRSFSRQATGLHDIFIRLVTGKGMV